jgi:hypothetical protein
MMVHSTKDMGVLPNLAGKCPKPALFQQQKQTMNVLLCSPQAFTIYQLLHGHETLHIYIYIYIYSLVLRLNILKSNNILLKCWLSNNILKF